MEPIQSTISSKNQVVIPAKIRRALNLKPGRSLLWQVVGDKHNPKAVAQPKPAHWAAKTRGLGSAVWQNTNLDEYIDSLREEWQPQT